MKRLTIRVDDETYTRAVAAAADRNISLDALVQGYLEGLVEEEVDFETLKQREIELRKQISDFNASDRLTRDEAHDRERLRRESS